MNSGAYFTINWPKKSSLRVYKSVFSAHQRWIVFDRIVSTPRLIFVVSSHSPGVRENSYEWYVYIAAVYMYVCKLIKKY